MATRSSCEPMLTSTYSEDMRWRTVWQREIQGLTLERVAHNLYTVEASTLISVDVSTVLVHRIVKKFEETGSVSKKKYSVANRQQYTDYRHNLNFAGACAVLYNVFKHNFCKIWPSLFPGTERTGTDRASKMHAQDISPVFLR